jgi:hypothetical protein
MKVNYYCEICGRMSKNKEEILDCEARGVIDTEELIKEYQYIIHQDVDSKLTFAIKNIDPSYHQFEVDLWACRDNGAGDTLDNEICGNCSSYKSMINPEKYSGSYFGEWNATTDLESSHFKRMVQYLIDNNIPVRYWDGVEIKTLDTDNFDTSIEIEEEITEVTEEVKEENEEVNEWSVYKVGEPSKDSIVFKRKAVYFTDWAYTDKKRHDEVCDILATFDLYGNIEFKYDVKITTTPPFDKLSFSILLFDYGGVMGIGADNMVWSHCKELVLHALKNPKKDYILTSSFHSFQDYMKEAVEDVKYRNNGEVPQNIYFSVKDFLKKNNYYNKKLLE